MSFQDRSQTSVSSLLALLRSAQDGEGEGEGEAGQSSAAASGAARAPAQNSNAHVNTPPPAQPSATGALGRNSHLSALLAQLAPSLPPPAAAPSSTHRGSAFEGPSRDLLEPFGPVGRTPAPRAQRRVSGEGSGEGTPRRPSEAESEAATPWPDKGKRKADEMEDRADWSFTRCLPVLTDLLRDDEFVKEVRKMKKDQDALERRLWARMEKVKAEHAAKQAPERQIAKMTRKPVSTERAAQWERELKTALSDLFVRHVLPSLDGLEARQVARLAELGVPGLGAEGKARGEDARTRQVRVRRIVGVLEGALEG